MNQNVAVPRPVARGEAVTLWRPVWMPHNLARFGRERSWVRDAGRIHHWVVALAPEGKLVLGDMKAPSTFAPGSLGGDATRHENDTRPHAFEVALYSGDLDLVPTLADARDGARGYGRAQAADRTFTPVARIFEHEVDRFQTPGRSESGHEVGSFLASTRKVGDKGVVFGEAVLSVDVAGRLEQSFGDLDAMSDARGDETNEYVDMLEAMTGVSAVGLYDEEVSGDRDSLQKSCIRVRTRATGFEDGQRTSPGWPVPD